MEARVALLTVTNSFYDIQIIHGNFTCCLSIKNWTDGNYMTINGNSSYMRKNGNKYTFFFEVLNAKMTYTFESDTLKSDIMSLIG